MLQVQELEVCYDRTEAVKNVSLGVAEGGVVALLGSNGAGKTTILNAVSGFLTPRAGDIQYRGKSIRRRKPYEIVSMGIVQVSQGRDLFTDLSVSENLRLGGVLEKDRKKHGERLQEVFEIFPILKERSNQRAGTLSGGEQQMLAMARAMMANPKLLLLDEPTTGLAPIYVKRIEGLLQNLIKRGITMLLVEQNAPMAVSLSQYFYALRNGRLVAEGETAKLPENVHDYFRKFYI
ncbi:MAG TPA: ABC transporter ATP-binding protein [Candidatus Sulfotelmatobacter sp.]|nr:ABC transporter ATP-binding protein [Candidatus Sulfotelmatobacter sp.]